MSDFTKHRLRYAVTNESGQMIAAVATRWTADRLIEGIKAHDDPTSRLGSWSVTPLSSAKGDPQ